MTTTKNPHSSNETTTSASKNSKKKNEKDKKKKVAISDEVEDETKRPETSSCQDQGIECRFRSGLCTNPLYDAIMRDQCPLTCNFCTRNTDNNEVDAEEKNGLSIYFCF
jgi:hypothetical protein